MKKSYMIWMVVLILLVIFVLIQQAIIKDSKPPESAPDTAAAVQGFNFDSLTRIGRAIITSFGAGPAAFPNPLNLPIIDDENDCPICQDGVSTAAPADQFGSKISEDDARAKLATAGVKINKPAPATQLNDMPDKALDAIIAVKKKSGADVTVTGGTEPGHATHGCGLPIFDLKKTPELDAYLRKGKAVGMTKFGNTKYDLGEIIPGYTLECTEELNKPGSAGRGWASHWHCRLVAKSCQEKPKTAAPSKKTAPAGTVEPAKNEI